MELLDPLENIDDWHKVAADRRQGESGQPQLLTDAPQRLAMVVGRQNACYDPVWSAAKACYPRWLPVRCDTARRAILLASSAIQHRTEKFQVMRRGRLVCLKHEPAAVVEDTAQDLQQTA